MFTLLSLVVFAAAYLSWKYVEKPFRDRKRVSRRQVLLFSIAGTAICIAFGLVGFINNGFPSRLPPNSSLVIRNPICEQEPSPMHHSVEVCRFGAPSSQEVLALFGDPHAMAISRVLDRRLRQKGISGISLRLDPKCHVIPQIFRVNNSDRVKDCVDISIDQADYFKRNRFILSILSSFESRPNFIPIKPALIFCDTYIKGMCAAQFDRLPFYADDDHLSEIGAGLVIDRIFDSAIDTGRHQQAASRRGVDSSTGKK